MKQYQDFYEFLQKYTEITEQEFGEIISPLIVVRNFKKRQIILEEGSVEPWFSFIETGLIRTVYKGRGEEEITIKIYTEKQLSFQATSFFSNLASPYQMEAIEHSTMLSINYESFMAVLGENQRFERMGREIITDLLIEEESQMRNRIILQPRDRFLSFAREHAGLMQRVPQKILASYLSIQPETFSRFKHMLKSSDNNSKR